MPQGIAVPVVVWDTVKKIHPSAMKAPARTARAKVLRKSRLAFLMPIDYALEAISAGSSSSKPTSILSSLFSSISVMTNFSLFSTLYGVL
jgi:hypothetical protein